MLLSTCADGHIKIWEINADEEDVKGTLKSDFFMQLSEQSDPSYLLPTSATWVQSNPV